MVTALANLSLIPAAVSDETNSADCQMLRGNVRRNFAGPFQRQLSEAYSGRGSVSASRWAPKSARAHRFSILHGSSLPGNVSKSFL
jgi:hypothetical protein